MKAQKITEKLLSFTAQNKHGGNCGFGNILLADTFYGDQPKYFSLYEIGAFILGDCHVGDVVEFNGIYRRRRSSGGTTIVKENWYVTKNPRTESQQANRGKFADAIAAWHELTPEDKNVYNIASVKTRGTGFNLFIRDYMRA